jgi:hypothetical protein
VDMPIVTSDGVLLVHRFPLEGGGEIHAYFQPHEDVLKAHLRFATFRKDGSVSYTPKGITVPPELLNDLLTAAALLAVEKTRLVA